MTKPACRQHHQQTFPGNFTPKFGGFFSFSNVVLYMFYSLGEQTTEPTTAITSSHATTADRRRGVENRNLRVLRSRCLRNGASLTSECRADRTSRLSCVLRLFVRNCIYGTYDSYGFQTPNGNKTGNTADIFQYSCSICTTCNTHLSHPASHRASILAYQLIPPRRPSKRNKKLATFALHSN